MGIYTLSSEDLFLRSAGKSQVMVVKLTKDVHSAIVETKDWKVEEIIGSNLTYDTLQISGHKITGQDLKKLATNLCESRLWVNKDGISFSRLSVTSLSFLVILFYQTKHSFDWSQFGVKNNDGQKSPDEKIKELMNDVKNKTAEIARLNKLISSSSSSSISSSSTSKSSSISSSSSSIPSSSTSKSSSISSSSSSIPSSSTSKSSSISSSSSSIPSSSTSKSSSSSSTSKSSSSSSSTSKSSSSSSSSVSLDTQYAQIINKCIRPVLSIRFNALNYSSNSWNNPPDLSSMPTYRPVDEIVINRYPSGINVYVNNGSFQKDNWSFIKIKDEKQGFESLFAFYRGVYDRTITYYGNHRVNIPYSSSATLQANVRFLAVTLRGYGPAFGFCYTR